ncbi:InlB B-repeat-containing protein [Enterococcus mundtii]|uniref:WxL domain-containing protein n=1 Tax=Enterococcus mundtii TaxID=53346 RepID=A0A242KUA6_ENTMU|nr:WxL domain-containing protein [Enterococcus mundtii]OTP19986.1 hypothetical protein A5802_003214 [Enterococcus mundtii]OTP24815.1 hypothetical protein A5802_002970 [Enterococcus mundtii]
MRKLGMYLLIQMMFVQFIPLHTIESFSKPLELTSTELSKNEGTLEKKQEIIHVDEMNNSEQDAEELTETTTEEIKSALEERTGELETKQPISETDSQDKHSRVTENREVQPLATTMMDASGTPLIYGKWYFMGPVGASVVSYASSDYRLKHTSLKQPSTGIIRKIRLIKASENQGSNVLLSDEFRIEMLTENGSRFIKHQNAVLYVTGNSSAVDIFSITRADATEYLNAYYLRTVVGQLPGGVNSYRYWARNDNFNLDSSTIVDKNYDYRYRFNFFNSVQMIDPIEGGTATIDGEKYGSYNLGETAQLSAQPSAGYKFVKWSKDGGDGIINDVSSANTTLSAGSPLSPVKITPEFERATYQLKVTSTEGGSATSGVSSVKYGNSTSLTAKPDAGFRFVRWDVQGEGSTVVNSTAVNTSFTMGTEDAKVTAIFEKIETYSLEVTASPTSGGSVTPKEATLSPGKTSLLLVSPNPGYSFVRWEVTGNGSYIQSVNNKDIFMFIMGTEDARVTAIFEHKLKAEAISQTLKLGEELYTGEEHQLVKDVTYDGQPLKADEYEVTIEKQANTEEVGKQSAEVSIIHKESNTKITVTIPVTVQWGNAIRIKGYADLPRGAFVYHPQKQKILPRWGIFSESEYVNNTEFASRFYYSIRQLRGEKPSFSVENSQVMRAITANGNSAANIFESQGREWATEYGDIIEVKHMQPSRLTMMLEEQESNVSTKENQAYFELTKEGYQLLHFDRVIISKVSLNQGVTKENLDKEVSNYVDLTQAPNVEIVGFTTYPDTTNIGESKGTIRVQEKLTTGKYIQKDYEIPFTIEAGLEAEVVPQTLSLSETLTDEKTKQFVKNVTVNGKSISDSEYVVELLQSPDTELIGDYETTIRISTKDGEYTKTLETKTKVVWGNTIVSKNYPSSIDRENEAEGVNRKEDVSVSLLIGDSGPFLVANNGSGLSTENQLVSRPQMMIYRNDESQRVLDANYGTVNQRPQSLKDTWNKIFTDATLSYGDVMVYSVNRFEQAAVNERGNNTWISRDNKLTRETVGYEQAYYEITKDGYQLMGINKLNVNNNNSIPKDTTKEEMNNNIEKFIQIPEGDTGEYRLEFESVDTSTIGAKTSNINVYQKLKSGGEFMKVYPVNYHVESNILQFGNFTNSDFDFGEVKKSSLKQSVSAKGNEAPTITISDYSEVSNWQIQVSQKGGLRDSQGNELKGAAITLDDLQLLSTVHHDINLSKNKIMLSDTPQAIATVTKTTDKQEYGYTVLQIGESVNNELSGVKLTIPNNSVMNKDSYHTVIEWELITDPFIE